MPADQQPKSRPLDWSAPVVAGTAQLVAVIAERDQLRDALASKTAEYVATDDRRRGIVLGLLEERDQLRADVNELQRRVKRQTGCTDPSCYAHEPGYTCCAGEVDAKDCSRMPAPLKCHDATAQSPVLAAAARVPLNREQVNQIMRDAGYSPAPAQSRADFTNGLRYGERAHGIRA